MSVNIKNPNKGCVLPPFPGLLNDVSLHHCKRILLKLFCYFIIISAQLSILQIYHTLLEFNAFSGENAFVIRVFNFSHFRDIIRSVNNLRIRLVAGNDQLQ